MSKEIGSLKHIKNVSERNVIDSRILDSRKAEATVVDDYDRKEANDYNAEKEAEGAVVLQPTTNRESAVSSEDEYAGQTTPYSRSVYVVDDDDDDVNGGDGDLDKGDYDDDTVSDGTVSDCGVDRSGTERAYNSSVRISPDTAKYLRPHPLDLDLVSSSSISISSNGNNCSSRTVVANGLNDVIARQGNPQGVQETSPTDLDLLLSFAHSIPRT